MKRYGDKPWLSILDMKFKRLEKVTPFTAAKWQLILRRGSAVKVGDVDILVKHWGAPNRSVILKTIQKRRRSELSRIEAQENEDFELADTEGQVV